MSYFQTSAWKCGVTVEHRKIYRYQLRVPAVIQWGWQPGIRQQVEGFTRDISTRGVFVCCPVSPPAGAAVELEIRLPPLAAAAQGLRLQAEGQVVRVDGAGTESGFAAVASFGLHAKATDEETRTKVES